MPLRPPGRYRAFARKLSAAEISPLSFHKKETSEDRATPERRPSRKRQGIRTACAAPLEAEEQLPPARGCGFARSLWPICSKRPGKEDPTSSGRDFMGGGQARRMRITFPKLKSRSWLLLVLFLLAASGSSFFAGLSFERARHLSSQQDEPITGWMSLNYVAHAYHVPSETLHQALGLEPFPPDRRTLKEIAEERG